KNSSSILKGLPVVSNGAHHWESGHREIGTSPSSPTSHPIEPKAGSLGTPSSHPIEPKAGSLGTPSSHPIEPKAGSLGTPSSHPIEPKAGSLGTPSSPTSEKEGTLSRINADERDLCHTS